MVCHVTVNTLFNMSVMYMQVTWAILLVYQCCTDKLKYKIEYCEAVQSHRVQTQPTQHASLSNIWGEPKHAFMLHSHVCISSRSHSFSRGLQAMGKWRPGDNLQQIWSTVQMCCDATYNRCRDVGQHICGRHGTLSARHSLTSTVRGSLLSCSLFSYLLHLKKRQDQNPRMHTPEGCLPWKPGASMFQAVPSCWFVAIAIGGALRVIPVVLPTCSCPSQRVLNFTDGGGGGGGGRTSFPTHMCTYSPNMIVLDCHMFRYAMAKHITCNMCCVLICRPWP